MVNSAAKWGLGVAIAALLIACGSPAPVSPPESLLSPSPTPAPPSGPRVAAPVSSPVEASFLVVPGERVGAVTSATRRADLVEIYGEAQLKDEAIAVGEGFTEPGTVVMANPETTFTVIWTDDSRTQPLRITDFGPLWKTPEGLGVQSSFDDLKASLGQFQLYGFAWDYAGTVVLEGSQLDRYHGDLFLRAQPGPAAIAAHPEAYQAVLGDQVFASDNPNMDALAPQVYAMEVYLNPLGE